MAKDGLHNLSMQKIAKEAQISAGTIYIYFKSKDELLEQFARRVFSLFSAALEKGYDENRPYFERYRTIWWNVWHYLEANPMITSNILQYQSLPNFHEICRELEEKGCWTLFCRSATQAGVLCDLPPKVLFILSVNTAIDLAFDKRMFQRVLTEDMLEKIIEQTWRSIRK